MDEAITLEVSHASSYLDGVLTQGRYEVAMTVDSQTVNEGP